MVRAASRTSVAIEGGKERGLESVILGALRQVAVHLASRTEDALNTCGGRGSGKVLLHHLRQVGPLCLLDLPPSRARKCYCPQPGPRSSKVERRLRRALACSCPAAAVPQGRARPAPPSSWPSVRERFSGDDEARRPLLQASYPVVTGLLPAPPVMQFANNLLLLAYDRSRCRGLLLAS